MVFANFNFNVEFVNFLLGSFFWNQIKHERSLLGGYSYLLVALLFRNCGKLFLSLTLDIRHIQSHFFGLHTLSLFVLRSFLTRHNRSFHSFNLAEHRFELKPCRLPSTDSFLAGDPLLVQERSRYSPDGLSAFGLRNHAFLDLHLKINFLFQLFLIFLLF
jgi:hypothetical protein